MQTLCGFTSRQEGRSQMSLLELLHTSPVTEPRIQTCFVLPLVAAPYQAMTRTEATFVAPTDGTLLANRRASTRALMRRTLRK